MKTKPKNVGKHVDSTTCIIQVEASLEYRKTVRLIQIFETDSDFLGDRGQLIVTDINLLHGTAAKGLEDLLDASDVLIVVDQLGLLAGDY